MHSKDIFLSWGMLFIGVIMNVMGMYFIKMKMNELGGMQVSSVKVLADYFLMFMRSPLAVVGVALFLLAPLPYAVAVSRMELSVAYPLSIALSCLIIVPLTFIFFGESVTANKVIAIFMILGSLYFLYK
ncbi:MAG: hypothetical protein WC779_00110 [Candidatus Omnitrophota bacterium]|jgi:multidrug transporter EmrE-like cation transporter